MSYSSKISASDTTRFFFRRMDDKYLSTSNVFFLSASERYLYEAPTPGHFGSMEQEIPFRCINRDYFNMVDPTQPLELTLRGAIQYAAASTQATEYMGMRVVFRGKPKNVNIGTVRQRGSMDSTITLELTYVLVEMDGKSMIEIDKINPTYKVNGNDVLSKVKQLT